MGSYGLALQFHPEVDHRQIEAWLVGHAVELQQAKVSISRLREDSAVFGPPAMKAGRRMLENWLRLGLAPLRQRVDGMRVSAACRVCAKD